MSVHKNIGTVKVAGSNFLWEIKNFCISCKNIGDYLISPIFSTTYSSTEHKWHLYLYPKGCSESNKHCISLFLKYMGQDNVKVNIILSLLNDKYSKVHELDFHRLYETDKSSARGFLEFIEHNFISDKINRVLVDDTINILCEIIYDANLATPLKSKCVKEKEQDNLPDYCRLKEFDEFEKLWEADNSKDVIIKINEDEIKAHKLIIMNRSPVFQAMFEHDMKEKEQSVVEITDIKYNIMKEVIKFMYTGRVDELEKIADDLLLAAEKYSMKGLKVLCEKQIFKNLTTANAVGYLKLADMCNATNLKSEIIKFIVRNQNDVVHASEFKLLPIEIECEVLRAIAGIDVNK